MSIAIGKKRTNIYIFIEWVGELLIFGMRAGRTIIYTDTDRRFAIIKLKGR